MVLIGVLLSVVFGIRYGVVVGLSMNYYVMNCPFADGIVKNVVNNALQDDPTLAAGLVRMHFHDCFIQGCDASILIDSTKDNTTKKDSPANLSLRGHEIIDAAKEKLEQQCPRVVSCADIIAMVARDAVFFVRSRQHPGKLWTWRFLQCQKRGEMARSRSPTGTG